MTVGELVNMSAALAKISSMDLPIKVSHPLSRIVRLVNPDLEQYELSRGSLFERFGGAIEIDGEPTGHKKITDENQDEFEKEHGDLLARKLIIVGVVKLSIDDMIESGMKLDAAALAMLDPFIDSEVLVPGDVD